MKALTNIRYVLAILALGLIQTASLAQTTDNAPSIEELMSAEDMRATGISSLSQSQKAALSQWLVDYKAGISTSVAATVEIINEDESASTAAGQEESDNDMPQWRKKSEKVDFTSRIMGNFEGWEGATQFTLENGQVWRQRRGRRWKTNLVSPEVRIYQNFMGAYEMEVLSEGRSIGVRRVR